ncbi:hypothetical protein KCM76_12230 [Zooshikella marina]|uniref:hypothetical protein n=1 Tax=Zooshikella ganghwensis TaxID=202772 RepID=UPI001BAEADB5|nr:hypothetical protein [Zooshikella ganghwensis]MBU2706752.1 hypothetical protein [Zooshikella ganghwensis]
MLKHFLLVTSIIMSSHVIAESPVKIENLETSLDCINDQVEIVQGRNGEYYIEAFFFDMDATIDGTLALSQKKSCLMNYNLKVAPGYRLEFIDFSVDANYELSNSGSVRLTVSHRVENAPSVRTTVSKRAANGDPLAGDINDHTGTIKANQLGHSSQQCGASIPLKTSLYAQARMPSTDRGQITSVTLDEGVSSSGFDIARVRCVPCS